MKNFKFLEHTADVKFQARGKTLEELFIAAAQALKETISGKIKVKAKKKKKIKIKGKDYENLLYNFLEEILFLLDAEFFLISKIENLKIYKKKEYNLIADVLGDQASNYNFTNEVKAITYNEMFVRQEGKEWICQVVIDV